MNHLMLKAKLHLACVTHAELDYDGSCAIDSDILEQAGLREYEQIHIYNKSPNSSPKCDSSPFKQPYTFL